MSGGAYDYFCYKIEDFAYNIWKCETNPRRAAFQKLMLLVAKAAHDIEWVDSSDYGEGDENEAIDKVFNFITDDNEKIVKAHAHDSLREVIEEFYKNIDRKKR